MTDKECLQVSNDISVLESTTKSSKKISSIHYSRSKCDKHQTTPLKTRSKASKAEDKDDVHSSCSIITPVTSPSRLNESPVTSPYTSAMANTYYLDICSQDLPEIVWDYSTPKQTEEQLKNERVVVIDDLLQNLQTRKFECPGFISQSTDLKLLDKWMSIKGVSPSTEDVGKKFFKKRKARRSPQHLIEELQSVLDSIRSGSSNAEDALSSKTSANSKEDTKITENDSSNLDYIDEWSHKIDDDDFILVKATQELESCLLSSQKHCDINSTAKTYNHSYKKNTLDKCYAPISTIDAANNKSSMGMFQTKRNIQFQNSPNKTVNKETSVSKISSNINHVYEEAINDMPDEFDDIWDNELDSETLSQIPDEVLMGKILDEQGNCSSSDIVKFKNANKSNSTFKISNSKSNKLHTTNSSNENIIVCSPNNFEELSDPFEDALPMNELLTWLDKTESQFTSKCCTPEEIARKKENALKKLRQKRTNNKYEKLMNNNEQ